MCNAWTGQIFYDPKEFYDPHPLVRQGGGGTPLADKIRQTVFDTLLRVMVHKEFRVLMIQTSAQYDTCIFDGLDFTYQGLFKETNSIVWTEGNLK